MSLYRSILSQYVFHLEKSKHEYQDDTEFSDSEDEELLPSSLHIRLPLRSSAAPSANNLRFHGLGNSGGGGGDVERATLENIDNSIASINSVVDGIVNIDELNPVKLLGVQCDNSVVLFILSSLLSYLFFVAQYFFWKNA